MPKEDETKGDKESLLPTINIEPKKKYMVKDDEENEGPKPMVRKQSAFKQFKGKSRQEVMAEFMILLNDDDMRDVLKKFMSQNHSEHHLLFWEECRAFDKIKHDDKARIANHGKAIIDNFIKVNSKNQVNIPQVLRVQIEAKREQCEDGMFAEADLYVTELIRGNYFFQFIDSDLYRIFKDEMEDRATLEQQNKAKGKCCCIM